MHGKIPSYEASPVNFLMGASFSFSWVPFVSSTSSLISFLVLSSPSPKNLSSHLELSMSKF